MAGGGGPAQSSSTFQPPGWAEGDLKKYLSSIGLNVFGSGGPGGNPLSMPAGLNQQTAPFNATENAALSGISGVTGAAENINQQGAADVTGFASGANAGPTNPYLAAFFNAAAQPTASNFANSVLPGLQAQGETTGSFGGTGMATAENIATQNFGNTLANLGASIYEPAYQQGQQLQLQAGGMAPGAAASLYQPYQAQYGAGAAQQQQQQAGYNTAYQNSVAAQQFPFALLSEYGQALGMGLGSGGTTIGTQPQVGGKL